MKILLSYLKAHRTIVLFALFLAAMNIGFSLIDPYISGRILDTVIRQSDKLAIGKYLATVLKLVGMAIGVAMVSRIAKNFQDYFTNIITQKTGAKMYADGLKHSLELPYQVFEDQRSGETLGILQKVRTDSEAFITAFIGILFVSLTGMTFVIVYSLFISYKVTLVYLGAIPVIAFVSTSLSKRIKRVQRSILAETTALAGSTTESLRNIELVKSLGLVKQEVSRLNNTTYKILGLELKKVKYVRSLGFVQGTTVNLVRSIMVVVLLLLIHDHTITPGQYLSLLFYSFFLFNPLQELGNVIVTWREAEVSLANFERITNTPIDLKPELPIVMHSIISVLKRTAAKPLHL
jgi:ATP-binding cassette subfamily B protein